MTPLFPSTNVLLQEWCLRGKPKAERRTATRGDSIITLRVGATGWAHKDRGRRGCVWFAARRAMRVAREAGYP